MSILEFDSYRDGPRPTRADSGNRPAIVSEQIAPSRMSLMDYWRIVRRYKWAILAFAIAAGLVGAFNALSTTSIYQAHARLWISANRPQIGGVNDFEAAPLHWLFFQTQSDIIQSQAVAELVVERLELKEPELKQKPQRPDDSLIARFASAGKFISDSLPEWRFWLPEELRPPKLKPLDENERRALFISGVLGGLSVSGGDDSEVLNISYESPDPKTAAKLANAFAETYIEFGLESRTSNIQQATSWLGRRIEELREKIVASEDALREYQAREGLIGSDKREQIISAKVAALTAELIKAQSRRNEAQARYTHVKSVLSEGNHYEALTGAIDSNHLLDAHREKVKQEQRVMELSQRYGDKHPKMISAKAELEDADRRLKTEMRESVDGVRKELDLAIARERQYQKLIDTQQKEMREISGKASEMQRLEREVEANRRLYETFLARFKEANVAGDYDVPNARIIDRAMTPTTPYKPNRKRIVLVYVMFGLTIGILNAFLRDHLSNKFKSKEDVEDRLSLPVIGVVPRLKLGNAAKKPIERHVLASPRSPFAEVINDVRTAILFSHIDTPSKVVLVTSALAGEGKTTLVSNLALSFAKRGPTLLIDADLRRGRVEQITNLPNHLGLTDMLSGVCTPQEAFTRDSEVENLFVLTSGTRPPNPLEILSSQRFSDSLESLREKFEYIIIDGTPLLPVSDSLVLARQVDATILAVKTDVTAWDITLEALKRLRAVDVEPVGVVMQQVDMRKMLSYRRRYVNPYDGYYAYPMPKTG